jgi:hypothetical protein
MAIPPSRAIALAALALGLAGCERYFAVTAAVRDDQGRPLEGVQVRLVRGGKVDAEQSGITRSSGCFVMSELENRDPPEGHITMEKEGFKPAEIVQPAGTERVYVVTLVGVDQPGPSRIEPRPKSESQTLWAECNRPSDAGP